MSEQDTPDSPTIRTITGFDGESKKWRVLSARLKAFWEKYPAKEGYSIRCEARDYLATKPELATLYREAIATGKSPSEYGLPDLANAARSVVMQARLECDGRVVAEASTLRPIVNLSTRDWECAETAAVNRLLAKLGMGGEILDFDEAEDLERAVPTPPPAAGGKSESDSPTQDTAPEPEKPQPPTNKGGSKAKGKGKAEAEPQGEAAAKRKQQNDTRKFTSMKRQIRQMEEKHGVEPGPEPTTLKEAITRIRELATLAR